MLIEPVVGRMKLVVLKKYFEDERRHMSVSSAFLYVSEDQDSGGKTKCYKFC